VYPALCVAAWGYCVAAAVTVLTAACVAAAMAVSSSSSSDGDRQPVGAFLCPDCASSDDEEDASIARYWRVPVAALPSLAWWIAMATVLNYGLQMWAIQQSSPTLVTSYQALQPVATAILTVALLATPVARRYVACDGHDKDDSDCLAAPPAWDLLGCALVVVGLFLVIATEAESSSSSSSSRSATRTRNAPASSDFAYAALGVAADDDDDGGAGDDDTSEVMTSAPPGDTTADAREEQRHPGSSLVLLAASGDSASSSSSEPTHQRRQRRRDGDEEAPAPSSSGG